MDISRSEQVETDLDRLIERRDAERRKSEGERAREQLWVESVRRYHERQQADHRTAWCEHWRKMRAVHYGPGDEYDAKLKALENRHQEERNGPTTKDLEAEYRERKAKIRADSSLSWEKKELAVRRLGLEYDKTRRKLDEGGN